MNTKLTSICVFTGALLLPLAAYSADTMSKSTTTKESAGEYVDDAAITAKVKADLIKDKQVEAHNINVDTDKGVVMLGGTAKSQAEADKAVAIAKGVKGVSSVKSDIKVAAATSSTKDSVSAKTSATTQKTEDYVEDSVITTRVKADFVKDKQVDASDIKVETTKGVVHLSGTAKSQAEVDKAVAIAKSVKGVSSVKSDIKVLQARS